MAHKKPTTSTEDKGRPDGLVGGGLAQVPPVGPEPKGVSRRRKEICQTVRKAMTDLAAKREVNWMREGAQVEQAAVDLDKAMSTYIDGRGSKGNVRSAYKHWINTLEGDTNG